jgi:hypothetical protein
MIGKPNDLIKHLLEKDKDKLFELKPYSEKRSLTANSYLWVLYGKMSQVLKTSQDEVHLSMLKRYGRTLIITLIPEENPAGYFKYYEEKGNSLVNGKPAKVYKVFKRSSEMTQKEFSNLLDGVISECKELEIETLPPDELAKLKFIERVVE